MAITERNNSKTQQTFESFRRSTNDSSKNESTKNHRSFKLKGIWRETQLAIPKRRYSEPSDVSPKPVQKNVQIEPEILQRCNQLSYVQLRITKEIARDYKQYLDNKKQKNLDRNLDKTMHSSYFNYRLNRYIKEQKLKRQLLKEKLKNEKAKKKKNVEEEEENRQKRWAELSIARKPIKPPPVDRGPWKPLEQMTKYIYLAEPVKREELPQKDPFEVNKSALTYVPTDVIFRLYQPPKRYGMIEPPLDADRPVSKAALRYKITPTIEKLYVVKVKKEGTTKVPEEDLWKISPKALTYKATARIINLAKPSERK